MRNHGQCEGKLLYNSFSIIQLQTFCTEHLIPLESVPIQNTHSSVSDKEKKANRHETGPDRFIERIAEGNIDEQLFAHYTHNICRYRLGDFRIRIEVCYRAGEDRESPPITALLEGRVHVWAAVFFNRTVQISYRFIVPKIPRNESDEPGRADERYDGLDPAEFCTTDHPFDTDQLISVAGIAQHVEHWVYNEKLDRQEIDGSLDKVEISDFKLDKDSVFRPEGTGEGNLTFDEVQRRYRNYFDKTPQAEFRAPDHRYIYIDVWEDIAHTGDTDFGKMAEDEIIEHIETAHRAELVGLMTLYPMEWPYRMDSSYEDVCGRNIAIDTDDLVLANQNMSVVFGTYGRRGKGSPTDWKEHLARRDRYHVSWPEYLVLLEIVLAKKQTINYVLNRYIAQYPTSERAVQDRAERPAHGRTFGYPDEAELGTLFALHVAQAHVRADAAESARGRGLAAVAGSDATGGQVAREREQHDGDPPCRRHEVHPAVHIDRLAVRGSAPKRGRAHPVAAFLPIRRRIGHHTGSIYFRRHPDRPEDIRQNHAPIHPPQAQRAKNEPPIRQGIMTIRPYAPQDRQKLCDLFAELIENHKEYISHGELQMGIATDRGELAPDFRNAWLRYLDRQTADPETEIMLAEQDGTPTGFVIYGINRDGAAPYGMIYDVGLLPRHRSRGTGSLLVRTALDALREKGVADCYLESGVDNHSAHRFFEKFGFGQVSCIFRAKL